MLLKICNTLKISYKKQTGNIITFMLLGGIISFVLGLLSSWFLSIISIVITILLVWFYYNNLKSKYEETMIKKEKEFIIFYKYLEFYLDKNYTLLDALKESSYLIDQVLSDEINSLIIDYENDSSLKPFIDFSNKFENEKIKELIILLYKYNFNNYKKENQEILTNINEKTDQMIIDQKANELSKYNFFPILFVSLSLVLFAVFIFSIFEV